MSKIHFITGGQRSGKSAYAEKQTLALTTTPIYLATSKVWDDEHGKRILLHQKSRTNVWQTIEETFQLDQLKLHNKVVLLDCITLWLTNIYDACNYDAEEAYHLACKIWDALLTQELELIVVSNEIGMGLIPIEKSSRAFVDLQGKMNQYIAKKADEVTFMVSGLPLKVKQPS